MHSHAGGCGGSPAPVCRYIPSSCCWKASSKRMCRFVRRNPKSAHPIQALHDQLLFPRGSAAQEDSDRRLEPERGGGRFIADLDGFNLHAAVRIEADDDEGRERLVRYCARPCFALDRLRVLPDGRVAYRVKYAGRRGTHRVMTPVELLARVAALVARPRYPLLRYHGVLAPHAKWRSAVVPKAPAATHAHDDPSLRPTAAGERTESPTAPTTRRAQGRCQVGSSVAPRSCRAARTRAAVRCRSRRIYWYLYLYRTTPRPHPLRARRRPAPNP